MPQRFTAQQVAAEAIRDRQRIALGAGAELEVPFEVGGPYRIGLVLRTQATQLLNCAERLIIRVRIRIGARATKRTISIG